MNPDIWPGTAPQPSARPSITGGARRVLLERRRTAGLALGRLWPLGEKATVPSC